jgi:hypothetical protein
MPRQRRPPAKFEDSDVYERDQHARVPRISSSPAAAAAAAPVAAAVPPIRSLNPTATSASSSSDECPACQGRHRAHTCGKTRGTTPSRRASQATASRSPSRSRSPSLGRAPAAGDHPEPLVGPGSPVLTISASNPPFHSCALVTGGTGFMGSYLVQQLDAVACALGSEVVYLDVGPPRPDMPPLQRSVFYQCSLTDPDAIEEIFQRHRPDTVFHCASLIDCRPRPVPELDAVNVDGTQLIIDMCLEHGTQRLVYTSSIEVTYHDNRCDNVDETRTYPEVATQGYQRTKIAAEQLVLDANDGGDGRLSSGDGELATCSLRPGHIYGAGDDLFFLAKVGVNFGTQLGLVWRGRGGAPMSMVRKRVSFPLGRVAVPSLSWQSISYTI